MKKLITFLFLATCLHAQQSVTVQNNGAGIGTFNTPGVSYYLWPAVTVDFSNAKIVGFNVPTPGTGTFVVANVQNYGAKGDGVTDDTAAIQGAIVFAESLGGTVYFPATGRSYLVKTGPISITSPVSFLGDNYTYEQGTKANAGSVVTNNSTTADLFDYACGLGPVNVSNITFDEAGVATAGALFKVNGTSSNPAVQCTFRNVTFSNGWIGVWNQTGQQTTFDNCYFSGIVSIGALIENQYNTDAGEFTFNKCYFSGTNSTGISFLSGGGMRVIGCKFVNPLATGFSMSSRSGTPFISEQLVISASSFDGCTTNGISIAQVNSTDAFANIAITGNVLDNSGASLSTPLLNINGHAATSLFAISVVGNVFQYQTASGTGSAVSVANCRQIVIGENTFTNFGGGVDPTAITIASTVVNGTIDQQAGSFDNFATNITNNSTTVNATGGTTYNPSSLFVTTPAGLLVNGQSSANFSATNGVVVGTVGKTSSPSGGSGTITIESNDASNQLQGQLNLITSATAASRSFQIQAIEQGVAFRDLTLQGEGGNTLIGSNTDDSSGHVLQITGNGGITGSFTIGGPATVTNGLVEAGGSGTSGTYESAAPIYVALKSVTLLTTGTPANLATIVLPTGITRYFIPAASSIQCYAETAAGTLAAGTIQLRTATSGGGSQIGSTITPPASASAMTTTAGSDTVPLSATTIYLYQTGSSGNAGTVSIYIKLVPIL
jgi:Pectate lyase superfamily protein